MSSAPAGETFRDQFTGKEDQGPDFAVPYTDFDARHYSPALSRWLVPDPLSEKYYDVSPYVYCDGNTVMLVDVDGKKWLNPILIKCLKKNVNDRILELKNNSDRQEIKERVSFLQKSLIDIEMLAIDEENYYALSYNWDDAHYVRKGTGGIVFIEMSSDAIALHEIHHVAQSLSTGGLKFDGEGYLLNAASNLRKDSFDNSVERYSAFADQEIEAYKIQFAMDHSFPISSVNTLTDINVFSVGSIMDAKGEPVYEYINKLAEHLRLIHTFGK